MNFCDPFSVCRGHFRGCRWWIGRGDSSPGRRDERGGLKSDEVPESIRDMKFRTGNLSCSTATDTQISPLHSSAERWGEGEILGPASASSSSSPLCSNGCSLSVKLDGHRLRMGRCAEAIAKRAVTQKFERGCALKAFISYLAFGLAAFSK